MLQRFFYSVGNQQGSQTLAHVYFYPLRKLKLTRCILFFVPLSFVLLILSIVRF